MQITNLKESPTYFDQCIEIIEDSFQYEAPYSFKNDFNTLIEKDNLKNCFFINDNETVVATIFTLPKELNYKEYSTKALFFGGIAVHPEHRNKGLFKKLFNHIKKETKEYSLYLLWSDLTGLYEKFSFYEFGIIQEVRSDPNNLKKITPCNNLDGLKESYDEIKQKHITVCRNDKDWELINKNSSIQKYTRENGDSFFVHKGMDLQNVIHESYPLDMFNDTPFIKWNYLPKPETKLLLYMGFIKINNFELFSNFIKEISENKIKLIKETNKIITLNFENENFDIHEKALLQGMWGPQFISELSDFIPRLIIFGFDAT